MGLHVPVDESVIQGKRHDKVDQRLLDARGRGHILGLIAGLCAKEANRVCSLPVCHFLYVLRGVVRGQMSGTWTAVYRSVAPSNKRERDFGLALWRPCTHVSYLQYFGQIIL